MNARFRSLHGKGKAPWMLRTVNETYGEFGEFSTVGVPVLLQNKFLSGLWLCGSWGCVCRVMGPVRKARPGSAQVISSNNLIGFGSWRESVTCKAVILCSSAFKQSCAAAGLALWGSVEPWALTSGACPARRALGVTFQGDWWDPVPGCAAARSHADVCISPLTDLSSAKRKFADSLNEFKFRCIGDAETDDEICIGES